jgi:hypothetical protein
LKEKFIVLGRFILTRNTKYGVSRQGVYGIGEAAVLLQDTTCGDIFMLDKFLDGNNYITGEEVYLVAHSQCYYLGDEGFQQSDHFRQLKSYNKELIDELEHAF